MDTLFDPPDFRPIGVGDAGVFLGYCPSHDTTLFAPAEDPDPAKKSNIYISLFLRALSVEYCRKRQVRDFSTKLLQLNDNGFARTELERDVEAYQLFLSAFNKVYLENAFALFGGLTIDSVDYYCVPFSRNLEVSCCGCFDGMTGAFDSVITYNLISYRDISILVLSAFTAAKRHLHSFMKDYKLPCDGERLVNDIAFFHCEEPLISAKLWHSLSVEQKLALRLSLRHPSVRNEHNSPMIVKVDSTDFLTEVTPAVIAKLGLRP